jgi:hypothetical protein
MQATIHYFAIFPFFRLLLLFPVILFSLGCARYTYPTDSFLTEDSDFNRSEALSHSLYNIIPRHRSQIRWYDVGHWATWMLFGNDDDGIFGEDSKKPYKHDQPISFKKAVFWACRNPLHNFCFYTIGTAYCTNSELAIIRLGDGTFGFCEYSPEAGRVFGGKGSSFLLALHGWKPFISLRLAYCPHRSSQFYLGWRERGNFGVKFTPMKKKGSL